ncbi:MAG: iron ABC transporter permease, partial [Syntrophales bacterium]|nr:iron ABC transporter permease [Syntrophales bacterium]
MTTLFLAVSLVALLVGPGGMEPAVILTTILDAVAGKGNAVHETEGIIVFHLRLPRIGMAATVGAALAIAGVVFQALLRNPLADPYILGISGGAAFGAIMGIMLGGAMIPLGISAVSFLGAALTVFLLFGIAGGLRERSSHTLLLTGVIINAFFSAVIMFLLAISRSEQLH